MEIQKFKNFLENKTPEEINVMIKNFMIGTVRNVLDNNEELKEGTTAEFVSLSQLLDNEIHTVFGNAVNLKQMYVILQALESVKTKLFISFYLGLKEKSKIDHFAANVISDIDKDYP